MSFLYNFGLSQEDERTEAAALALDSGDHVLAVASAGDMPLSLLALGAGRVTAVDIDPTQLHLCWLKVAAVAGLEREAAARFLGFLSAPPDERERQLGAIAGRLPPASWSYWSVHRAAVRGGAIWAGRYERYVRRLVALVRPLLRRRIDGLFDARDRAGQEAYFDRTFDRPWARAIFAVAFHPRIYAHRGMDPRSLEQRQREVSVAAQYFGQFRDLCTANPNRENHHLQLHLLGRVLDADAVPAYLTRDGHAAARAALDRLELVQGDLVEHLGAAPVGRYRKLHLSNVPDWLPQVGFDRVMELCAARLEPGARLVWRSLHTDYPVPPAVADRLVVDRELGQRLRAADRFPFYDIIPAERV